MGDGPAASPAHGGRWAWAEVDLDAVAHNVAVLCAAAAPAAVWAVVKADAYGHGAVAVARTAVAAGAAGLCVALVQEAAALRAAGVAANVLVLSEQPAAQAAEAVALGVVSTVASADGIDALAAAAAAAGQRHRVHLKVDTGMHRAGCAPADAVDLAARVAASGALQLDGVFTHLATADEPGHPDIDRQVGRFDTVLHELARAGLRPATVHTANSAAALTLPAARHQMVRVGIALYGLAPGPLLAPWCTDLRPAMSLHARISRVHRAPAGDGVSYGLRHRFARETTVATVPLGYADGVARRSFEVGAEVLVRGRRRPVVGVVTMDQLMVDAGDLPVAVGDPVVVFGTQAGEQLGADEVAARLGTIGYEVVCAVSARVPRRHVGGPLVESTA